jgi:hypothetical protein
MAWTEEEETTLIKICSKHPSIRAAKDDIIEALVHATSSWDRVSRKARRLAEDGRLRFADGTKIVEKKVQVDLSPELLDKLAIIELIYPGSTREISNVPTIEKKNEIRAEISQKTGFKFDHSTILYGGHVVAWMFSSEAQLPGNTHELTKTLVNALSAKTGSQEMYARETIRKLTGNLPSEQAEAILNALDGN